MSSLTGGIVGYDPGGNGKHGFALLHIENGTTRTLETHTLDDAEGAISQLSTVSDLIGLGIDTMTCWSTGQSGWRPADQWLKNEYDDVKSSVVSPNGMYGSMGINGMAVLIEARNTQSDLFVTETHPKVLYRALVGKKYDYDNESASMDTVIEKELGTTVEISNDHEWDAALSTLAALRGLQGEWELDLHEKELGETARLIKPCGKTHYVWPTEDAA